MKECAPILLFCYNRPEHTKLTLDALSQNELADKSPLFIFCDGPKNNANQDQQNKIQEVRNIAKSYKWKYDIHVIESETNKGLAKSIISGVSEVIDTYGKVIVLEDDLLSSKYFLKYMNAALDYYEDRPSVFSISANRPPASKMIIPEDYPYDVFVSLRPFSTGWAVWKNRWDKVNWSMSYLEAFLSNSRQVQAFNRAGEDMTAMLCLQRDGKIDSWAIQFAFAHFYQHAVSIMPCISYIDNIGFDGSGIHSGLESTMEHRNNLLRSVQNPRFLDCLYEDADIINEFYNVYNPDKRLLWQKLINRIYKMMGRFQKFHLKKKIYNQ